MALSGGSDKKDNVYPLKQNNSLDDLVSHMRQVRDSIPVNQRLRRELRARLVEGRQALTGSAPVDPEKQGSGGRRWPWLLGAGSLVLLCLLVAALAFFRDTGPKSLAAGPVTEVARFWAQEDPLVPSLWPSGGLMVVERGGALLLLNRQGSRFAAVRPPAGQKYSSPAWSPDGGKLALVRDKGGGSELLVLNIAAGTKPEEMHRAIERGLEQAGALVKPSAGSAITDLAWSPDGGVLAYSLRESGQSRVFLAGGKTSPVSLGQGARPAWSPDGKWLVVEREGQDDKALCLVEREGGRSYPLGPGRFPVWNRDGYLLFVKTTIREKILSYLPDGAPQFTVQRKSDEIRWLRPGRGEGPRKFIDSPEGQLAGAGLLMAPDIPAGPEELQWLGSLELSGVREPRTLYINRVGEYEGMVSGEGLSLLLSRRDGGMIILTRINLVENNAKVEGR